MAAGAGGQPAGGAVSGGEAVGLGYPVSNSFPQLSLTHTYMKNFLSLVAATVLASTAATAQTPQRISYQAVVRNSSGALVTNTAVGMRISILQAASNGTAVYVETHTPTTNANGVATLQIGGGTVVSGTFSTINWAGNLYFLKTETDPAGGTTYSITGTTQFLSVPYALNARAAETFTGAAGGDLTGNYPNPSIAAGAIVGADIANTTIAVGKLSATGTASSTTFLRGDNAWAVPVSAPVNVPIIVQPVSGNAAYTATSTNSVTILFDWQGATTSSANSSMIITLPAANTVAAGSVFTFQSVSYIGGAPGALTLKAANGSDTYSTFNFNQSTFGGAGVSAATGTTTFRLVTDGISRWFRLT